MPIGSGYGNSGVPDFLVCHKGRFIGIEAKAGKGKPTALQQVNLDKISDSGGLAYVIWEDTVHVVDTLLQTVANLEDLRNGNFK
jgi:hypothetical protein